jgi:hypothetical protein
MTTPKKEREEKQPEVKKNTAALNVSIAHRHLL